MGVVEYDWQGRAASGEMYGCIDYELVSRESAACFVLELEASTTHCGCKQDTLCDKLHTVQANTCGIKSAVSLGTASVVSINRVYWALSHPIKSMILVVRASLSFSWHGAQRLRPCDHSHVS